MIKNVTLKNTAILLLLILVIATALRIVKLDSIPHGFHNDEASFFVNARTLSQTARDEDGRFLPAYLLSYIDPKPALYAYLQIPFITTLDNQVFAARLPGAILGIFSILVFYLFCKNLELPKHGALVATLLLTISPWHINVSRSTQEVIVSFFFSVLFLYLFQKFILSSEKKQYKILLLLGAFLSAALAMYSYHAAKIVLPLSAVILMLFNIPHPKRLMYSIFIGGSLILLAALIHFSSPGANDRVNAVGVFSNQGPQLILNEQIRVATGELPTLVLRLFHNKPVNYGMHITQNYLSHVSADFLFFTAGQPKRYQIPQHGLLYLIDLPLLIFGLLFAIRRYQKTALMLLGFGLISPLPAALTAQEIPSMIRSFFLIIPLTLFTSIGLSSLWKHLPRKIGFLLIIIIVLGYAWSLGYFLNQFSIQQRFILPWNRNVADQKMAQYVKEHADEYSAIVISRHSGQPYPYLIMENVISIDALQNSNGVRKEAEFSLEKVQFVENSCYLMPLSDTLFVIHQNCEITDTLSYTTIATASHEDGNDGYAMVVWEDPAKYEEQEEESYEQ